MKHSDEEILSIFKQEATQEKGFNMLVQAYQEKLYAQVWRITQNHNDTDDVLQNTLVKIWKGLHSFKGESQLSTWLYRIAQNETYTFLQKKNKQNATQFDDFKMENTFKTYNETITADDIEHKFQKALSTLPEKQREVFNLRYYDEMPYQEMSTLLGTSEGALKASYHIAAKKIETILISI